MVYLHDAVLILVLVGSASAFAGAEGMASMPTIQPKNVRVIKTQRQGEDLQEQRGFGEKEPEVRMMNLMMVEGSGYEGMDMAATSMGSGKGHDMQMAQAEKPSPAATADADAYLFEVKPSADSLKGGANMITVTILNSETKKPEKGLTPKATVYMISMNMGTDEPRVREIAPGKYQFKAVFSMQGPWAVKMVLPKEEKVFNFNVGTKAN